MRPGHELFPRYFISQQLKSWALLERGLLASGFFRFRTTDVQKSWPTAKFPYAKPEPTNGMSTGLWQY
ncbi:hypothetical protein ACSS6W_004964 [Trichoderma asperelloides]